MPLTGIWHLEALSGGPTLPAPAQLTTLHSWTELPDPAWRDFSGTTRYTLQFDGAGSKTTSYHLRFRGVGDSVRIWLNAHPLGTLWCQPWEIRVGVAEALRPGPPAWPSGLLAEPVLQAVTALRPGDRP